MIWISVHGLGIFESDQMFKVVLKDGVRRGK
jgi:hypothetical protein